MILQDLVLASIVTFISLDGIVLRIAHIPHENLNYLPSEMLLEKQHSVQFLATFKH